MAIYLLMRLPGLRFPAPIIGAAIGIGFLFMDSFTIYGGNIPSSMAGEYSFSLSVGLCLVRVGLAYRVAYREQKARLVLAAGVLALAVLVTFVPVIMVILASPCSYGLQ